ncbi:MAG: hypothetical protein ACRECN_04080, partial [Methylocella sp.]
MLAPASPIASAGHRVAIAKRRALLILSLSFHRFCRAVAKTLLLGFLNRENDPISGYRLSINVFRFTKDFAARGRAVLISGGLQNILLQRTMN